MICTRCFHEILPGQLFIERPKVHGAGTVEPATRPVHVACPSERQVQAAHRWGRWR